MGTLRLKELGCLLYNATARTEIYTLSLHDALPISFSGTYCTSVSSTTFYTDSICTLGAATASRCVTPTFFTNSSTAARSEEHTSELQSRLHLVCRLLLEKNNRPQATLRRPARYARY